MSTLIGKPSNIVSYLSEANQDANPTPGGRIVRMKAGATLLLGDFVAYVSGLKRAHKTLSSGYYTGVSGIVVGGAKTNGEAVWSGSYIGQTAAVAGEDVLVLVQGIGYAISDAAIVAGNNASPGRTTAGRIRGDGNSSYAINSPGILIKAGASALAEAKNATSIIVAGSLGTDTAALLDQAALSGTVNDELFGLFELRVASDGTTVTSAHGTDAATREGVLLPAGSATVVALGYIVVHPTGGNFVGGTTALDDGTVVPAAEYVDLYGPPKKILALEAASAAAAAVLVQIY